MKMNNLGLIKKKKADKDPAVETVLLSIRTFKLPMEIDGLLTPLVSRSHANYKAWRDGWGSITLDDSKLTRLLDYLLLYGFLPRPLWFVKQWVLTTVRKEVEWGRRGNILKWGVWHPRHKLWLEEGRKITDIYCGDAARFDLLLKELSK